MVSKKPPKYSTPLTSRTDRTDRLIEHPQEPPKETYFTRSEDWLIGPEVGEWVIPFYHLICAVATGISGIKPLSYKSL